MILALLFSLSRVGLVENMGTCWCCGCACRDEYKISGVLMYRDICLSMIIVQHNGIDSDLKDMISTQRGHRRGTQKNQNKICTPFIVRPEIPDTMTFFDSLWDCENAS